MSGERRLAARAVGWGAVESAAAAAVGLCLTPLLVRAFGIEGLGLWAACWSLAHAANVADCGVGAAYSRFTARAIAARDDAALNAVVGAGAGFHLALSLVVALAALVAGPSLLARLAPSPALARTAPLAFACVLATVCLRMTLSAFRAVVAGAQRLDLLGRIGTVTSLLEGGVAALIVLSGGSLGTLAVNALGFAVAASTAEALVAKRLCPGLRVRLFAARRSAWREILSFGARLQAARAGEILAAHAPRLALALGPGLAATGAYDLAARGASLLNLAGSLPLPVVQPLASRLDALRERKRLRTLVRAATRYVALLVIPAGCLLFVEARDILVAWTGRPAPPGAVTALRLLAPALALGLLASPLRLVLRGAGLPGIEAASALAGAVFNLFGAIALGGLLGAPGAAMATCAAAALAAAILTTGAARRTPDLVRAVLAPATAPVLAAGAAGAAAAALAGAFLPFAAAPPARREALAGLLPTAAILGGTVLLALVVLRAVGPDDLALLREVVLLPGRSGGRA